MSNIRHVPRVLSKGHRLEIAKSFSSSRYFRFRFVKEGGKNLHCMEGSTVFKCHEIGFRQLVRN